MKCFRILFKLLSKVRDLLKPALVLMLISSLKGKATLFNYLQLSLKSVLKTFLSIRGLNLFFMGKRYKQVLMGYHSLIALLVSVYYVSAGALAVRLRELWFW